MKIALVCIAKNEDYYLDEWLEYNYKLGFDRIIMYENNWRCSLGKEYLTKIPFDGDVKQLPAYNNFVKNNKEFDWAAFIDCDEFITLLKHNNIKELVKDYKDHDGIALNWFRFGSGGQRKRSCNSLLKQFKRRSASIDRHVKIIMNLKSNFRMVCPHCANIPGVDTNKKTVEGPFNPRGPTDVAYINHYDHKTFEDYKMRCERGRADTNNKHLFSKIKDWEERKKDNIDVLDINALKFMYGNYK